MVGFPSDVLILACEKVFKEPCLNEENEKMKSPKGLLIGDESSEGGSEGRTGSGLSPESICTTCLILGRASG